MQQTNCQRGDYNIRRQEAREVSGEHVILARILVILARILVAHYLLSERSPEIVPVGS